jgi:hypothetical protein
VIDRPLSRERGWITYFKALFFLIPPVTVWGVLQVFCIPKLKQICADAGVFPFQPLFHTTDFVADHGLAIFGAIVVCLMALEWEWNNWKKYRGAILTILIFIVNSAAIVSIAGMLVAALLVAPALMNR